MFEVDLSSLDLQDSELQQFTVDEEYPEQLPPGPPARGDYRFKIAKLTPRTNRDGEARLTDGKWPILCIEEVEIVEGLPNVPRRVMIFQDVRTKPFLRNGKMASALADILRAYDQNRVYSGLQEQLEALKEFVQNGATFVARGDWIAKDNEHAKARIEAAGGRDALTREELNAIYNDAEIRGMQNFPVATDRHGNTYHLGQVNGPSGAALEARMELRKLYPSGRGASITLGSK